MHVAQPAIDLFNTISEHGDATIDYVNQAGKLRYAVVTVDFTTPYVFDKMGSKLHEDLIEGDRLMVFSWDADKPIRISASQVKRITPLSKVINNGDGV